MLLCLADIPLAKSASRRFYDYNMLRKCWFFRLIRTQRAICRIERAVLAWLNTIISYQVIMSLYFWLDETSTCRLFEFFQSRHSHFSEIKTYWVAI